MRTTMIWICDLVFLMLITTGLAASDGPEAGRFEIDETDEEVLQAYWWGWEGWNSASVASTGVRWRWSLDQKGVLGREPDPEDTLSMQVEEFQRVLDTMWAEYDASESQKDDPEGLPFDDVSLLVRFGTPFKEGIEWLDPDKNRVFDPVIEFRNGRELIVVTDVQIEGNEVIMVFPDGKGRVVARENENGVLVGIWSVLNDFGERQEHPFWAATPPRIREVCMSNGMLLPDELATLIGGRWEIEFENMGMASCEFVVLKPDARPHFPPSEYSYVIANIVTERGEFRNLIGSVQYDRSSGREEVQLYVSYFDGSHAIRLSGQLRADNAIKGTFWSSDHGHDTYIMHKVGAQVTGQIEE